MSGANATATRRHELSTREPDVAHHAIAEAYAEHRPRFAGSRRDFRFLLRTVQAGPLGLDRIVHSMDAQARTGPYPDFMTVHVLRGRFRFRDGDEELLAPAGTVARYPTRPSVLGWTDVVGTMIRLPHAQVATVAAARTGIPERDFRFLGLAPVSAGMARGWARLSVFLHRTGDDGLDQPLVRASLIGLVATTALAVFPNTTMTAAYVPQPRQVASAVVRRAQAYLHERAAEPITVPQVATACGVGPRGLQAAFQRHVGQSPLAYLRRVRLDRAHRDLLAAEPGGADTVARIALRWGWASPGRFAAAYRETYGRSPGETLRE
ncbi:helix-turn-helix transcriptional regulator [Micromonospora robiginosa]|uniref:AraC family transcriptional regulator n=1 Tax=Micromonospora robiginosa TaxID=2749844 RepID=A0A7L6B313_9ACTN|nr:AraC family transcriptional regulator [Micromonospora ferruginea]QLQ36358.1 AraC family transcriptional regulator [Micromonospora ferruginea]